ncbi:hypothetical protein EUY87_08370, partial [Lactobacillus reuteri]|nr:hypothetical protein [Limosilactobacillus reuteri]
VRHLTDILSYRFGSLNMIPDVTPNGVFYLPPTGWLTSFYNPPNNNFEQKRDENERDSKRRTCDNHGNGFKKSRHTSTIE